MNDLDVLMTSLRNAVAEAEEWLAEMPEPAAHFIRRMRAAIDVYYEEEE